eukprot:jgi/Bigna1/144228/aug1.85_g18936
MLFREELHIETYVFDSTKKPSPQWYYKRDDDEEEINREEERRAEAVEQASFILSSVPPNKGHTSEYTDPVLEAFSKSSALRWAGYLSTTGVYGDHGGDWVDEGADTLAPVGSKPYLRKLVVCCMSTAAASVSERELTAAAEPTTGPPVLLGKEARSNSNDNGNDDDDDDDGIWVSRIHVADLVEILKKSILQEEEGPAARSGASILNIADDAPEKRRKVFKFARSLLLSSSSRTNGRSPPPPPPLW